MLETDTAYPITIKNINVLSHLSGKATTLLTANLGWCATYSETRAPRWMIVPVSVATQDMGFKVDTLAFN